MVTKYSFSKLGKMRLGRGKVKGRERGVVAEKESPLSTYFIILPAFAFTTECFFSLQKKSKKLDTSFI